MNAAGGVALREGQTLAVAGLIQNNLGTDSNRVPLFGDIPILGHLTGFDKTSMAEQELIDLELHEYCRPALEKRRGKASD